jgi:hypothetical protein
MDDYIAPRGEARCSRKNTLENDLCGATICYLDEGLPGPIHRTQVENFPAGPLSIPGVSGFPRALPHVATIAAMHGRCPLWVKSRQMQCTNPCPLFLRKRTFSPLLGGDIINADTDTAYAWKI